MQNIPATAFFILVVCSLLPKFRNQQIFLVIISLGINPIANQIGLFANNRALLLGNIFVHLIYPILISPNCLLSLIKIPGIFYLILLVASFFSLKLPADGISVSQSAGEKTILLMLGSWLWAQALAKIIKKRYGFLLNFEFVKACNISSIVVFTFSIIFEFHYFTDGRYQAAGGFNSPAILSGMIIILSLLIKGVPLKFKFTLIPLQYLILVLTGSRSVLIATMFTTTIIPIYSLLNRDRKTAPTRDFISALFFLVVILITIFSAGRIQNVRSLEFLSLLNSNSRFEIGTLGFRENMLNRMISEFNTFGIKSKIFGVGAGGGTVLAMEWISTLRDNSYTSARVFHNGLLQLLIENGILGVTIFLAIVGFTLHLNREALSYMLVVWFPFFAIAIFFSSNPFATSGLLSGLIYVPFLLASTNRVSDHG